MGARYISLTTEQFLFKYVTTISVLLYVYVYMIRKETIMYCSIHLFYWYICMCNSHVCLRFCLWLFSDCVLDKFYVQCWKRHTYEYSETQMYVCMFVYVCICQWNKFFHIKGFQQLDTLSIINDEPFLSPVLKKS
jgi:hypothetical protein